MMDYFVVDNNHNSLRIDSSEFVHPMTHYVEHPYEIDFHFNSVAYNKGPFTSLAYPSLLAKRYFISN